MLAALHDTPRHDHPREDEGRTATFPTVRPGYLRTRRRPAGGRVAGIRTVRNATGELYDVIADLVQAIGPALVELVVDQVTQAERDDVAAPPRVAVLGNFRW